MADVVNRAAYSGESVYLTRRGKRMAAVVPAIRCPPATRRSLRRLDRRVVYEVQDAQLLVLVVTLGHRREVYRKF